MNIVRNNLAGNEDSERSYCMKAKRLLYKRVHILQWLPRYTRNDVLADFISGLTVGLTMMPQSIAYAGLAGVDPQYGLYTAFIGSFTYIFFGTIREHLLPRIKTKNKVMQKIIKFMVMSKNAITVLLASLVAAYLHYNGGAPFKLTGKVPQGLPDFTFPALTTKFGNETVGYEEMVSSLSSGVIVVPVVAVLANVAIAKAYSQDVVVDASQEMISLGLCNIFGSFVQALPSCGAFTRSAVASSSDVRTPLQGLYSGRLCYF
ncbi:unnamed protein product [Phaedon cochleariae]|uniref:SLC26A/SulP transporter domain-containing protein n=1 Tax=Phaedon cochleariae TaxID=80249 RepID=A0A9P0DUV6_PHACE|nr:unnamed protein product [Phaedon cochleariae]